MPEMKYLAGITVLIICIILGMLDISNKKPDKMNVGKNALVIDTIEATTDFWLQLKLIIPKTEK